MNERAEFHFLGQPLDGTPLHYTASGLDYIYLRNGFSIVEDPDYGRLISIDDVEDLHRTIGLWLITQPRPLRGTEFRFLRKFMKFRQKDVAKRFGVDEQTIANYEKDKKIPTTSDLYMRHIFLLFIMPPDARAEYIQEVAELIQRHEPQDIAHTASEIHPPIIRQWHKANDQCCSAW